MIPASLIYDATTDQIVVRVPAADGEGDVELLRLDIKSLSAEDKRKLRDVRDPKLPTLAPGLTVLTRR